ncbi:MAG: gliding motility associated protein GldN [Patiriisocius sp.]|jgi:gliding motility associated protien GldN
MIKKIHSIVLVSIVLLTSGMLKSQYVLDGAYVPEHIKERKVVPYPSLRQADVMWEKRIWQILDMREKLNHPLYYPVEQLANRKSLFDVIRYGLSEEKSITAYSTGPLGQDDEFKTPLMVNEVEAMFSNIDTSMTEDLETGEFKQVIQQIDIESSDIKQFKLKESWLFDRQRSERYVRIIGIAPRQEVKGEDGEIRGTKDMFWLYFPECRYLFANWDVFNRNNDAERRSFDDVFMKRMFSSYVVRESSPSNRDISEYTSGIDHLLESERIKQDLMELEHDLWSY